MENLNIKIRLGDAVKSLRGVASERRKKTFETVETWIETLPLFKELDLDLQPILLAARRFRTFQDVVVLGTGGSCLSGKMYSSLKVHTSSQGGTLLGHACISSITLMRRHGIGIFFP